MPLTLPDRLPAIELLKQENIFVMDATRAASQDIPPLRIAVLNLMPLKITTETGTYAFLYSIGIDGAKEIRAGRYLRYNLLKQMKATYGANIVKLKDTADYVNAKDFNTMTTADYGSKTLHNDYKKIGSREVKKIINKI